MANPNQNRITVEESPEKGVIVQNIIIRSAVRKSQDIDNWRNAIRSAEAIHPIYIPLYDLYEDLMLDGVLTNLVKKKVLGVTKTKMVFVDKDKKEVPEMTELMKTRQFRRLRKEIQKQQIYGPTVIELINDEKGFRIYPVPRKHIRPKEGLIVWEQYGSEGTYYRTDPAAKFILEVGEWNELGLLMKAAQYVIYKRGGFGDWASFAEIFGMPFREARYDGYNETTRKQLEMAMEAAGSASYAILPKESEFKLHEASNAQGNGELYNTLRKACNEELAILFLGQAETTQKTAGSLGGNDETHEQTEDDINSDDKLDELSIFNENVKPILANLGLLHVEGSFIYEEQKENVPFKDKVDSIIRLKTEAELPIDDDYIYDMAGIPKPNDYAAIKAQREADKAAQQQQFDPNPQTDPKKKDKGKGKQQKKAAADAEKLSLLYQIRLMMSDFFDPAPKS